MSKGTPEQLDFEQQVIDNGDKNTRRANLMSVFKKDMQVLPLVDALKAAKVPRFDEIEAVCSEWAEEFEPEKRLPLSYVFAYTFEFGTD